MPEGRGSQALLQYGRSLLKRFPVRAARVFTRGIRLHPDDPKFRVARAEALAETCRGWRVAISDLKKALELEPGNAELHLRLAKLLYFTAADYASALIDYDAAISLGIATAEAFGGRAGVRGSLDDPAGAVAGYTRAIVCDPSSAWWHERRGEAMIECKDYAGAVEDFTQAIALAPKNKKLFECRARAYGWMGDRENASRDMDVYIAHLDKETSEYGIGASSLNSKAYALRAQGKLEEALRTWARAVEVEPQDTVARGNRATTLIREGRYLDAIEDLDAIAAISHDEDDFVAYLRAQCLEKLERWKEAAADLTYIITHGKPDSSLYARRGRARLLSGDTEGALDDLTKAVALDPEGTWGKWAKGLAARVRSDSDAKAT